MLLLSLSLFACNSDDDVTCGAPGGTQACVCVDAASGVQICGRNGAWGTCQCSGPQDMSQGKDLSSTPDLNSSPDLAMDMAPSVPGCTDNDASNFNAAANVDDGSCTYDVTFTVDLSKVSLMETDVIYVSGDFQSKLGQPDWCIDCAPMTDLGSRVYTKTIALPRGTYAYAFHVNARAPRETVPESCGVPLGRFVNRPLVVNDAPVDLGTVLFSACPCTEQTCSGINTCSDGECINRFSGVYLPGRFTITTERGICTQKMVVLIGLDGSLRLSGVDPTTGEPSISFREVSCQSGFQGSVLPMRVEVIHNGATTASPPNKFDSPFRLVFKHANFTEELAVTLSGSVSNGTFTGSMTGLPKTVSIGLDNEVRSATFISPEP